MPPWLTFISGSGLLCTTRSNGFGRNLMKAIVYYNYGSPDVLQYEEIEKPAAGDNEVLIKVRAASVNPLDCGSLKGVPYIFRIVFRLRRPTVTRPGRPGGDVAGPGEA